MTDNQRIGASSGGGRGPCWRGVALWRTCFAALQLGPPAELLAATATWSCAWARDSAARLYTGAVRAFRGQGFGPRASAQEFDWDLREGLDGDAPDAGWDS